tara:strand:+ start:90 stop:905 length:816 start_codon:yes stop_codon:yes gene_type:complete
MFLSKDFCYLELHRSASAHISKLLEKYFPKGKRIGIHDRADKDTYNSKIFFLGSIRNPWDWYVSMWAKACEKRGELYEWTALKKFRFHRLGLKTKPFLSPYIFFNQFVKPFKKWNEVYVDPKNLDNFRSWLKLILKDRIHDDGSGFGLSSIHNFSGQLTYRYLCLFSKRTEDLFNNSISNFDDMKRFDENYNVLNYVIKLENLENDFINFLTKLNMKVDPSEEKLISNLSRTNKSSRINNFIEYYDQESIDIVYQKERLIIDKYNYDLPKY